MSLAACEPADPKTRTAYDKSGKELAQDLISLSRAGTEPVPSKMLADKVCLIPEGVYANVLVQLLLPGAAVGELEDDSSEGIWFLILYRSETNLAYVKAIPQNIIEWDPADIPIRDLVGCVSELEIVREDKQFLLKGDPRLFIDAPELVVDGPLWEGRRF